ncbi:MAG: hypothetical protein MUO26_04280 [Methanotrichaceae archaeon]|nr:hypothetical protein [Methanotrichaceae archaeon]
MLPSKGNGFLYDESSIIRGNGHISIRGSLSDHAADSSGWMKGTGSINLESLRGINKIGRMVDFTQKSDLVFEGGQLKNKESLASPLFKKGIGASVNVRFNLSHVKQSEAGMIRSINRFDNTLNYNTTTGLEGSWAIKTIQGLSKSDQRYSGSYQIEKNIELNDSGKK